MLEQLNRISMFAEALTVGDLLARSAREQPDAEALVFPDHRATYLELFEGAVRTARGLHGLGVRPRDRVGVLMPNCPEFVHALFGAALLGAILVPINARFKRRELGYVIEDGDLVTLLTSDVIAEHVDFVELLHDTLPDLASAADPERLVLDRAPALRSVVLLGDAEPAGMVTARRFGERAAAVDADVVMQARARVRIRDVAMMPYTSGTTAYPKGCLLTHEALVRQWMAGGRRYDFRKGDRFWDPLPLFHLSGVGPLLFSVGLGGTFVCMTHFEPGAALAQIRDERATHLFPTFPPVTMALLRHPDYDPAALAHARMAATVAPPDTLELVQELLPEGVVLSAAYGLTECCGTVAANALDETLEQRTRTSGPPMEGIEIRTIDPETGRACAAGEPGELQVRGYSVFEGYHKDPEKTAATLLDDGWCRTGDIGVVDEAGRVAYVGRLKDMLKVGGENVAPSEIESHLSTHPAVQLVQVVGRPDEKYVEAPVAFVELVTGGSATAEELIDYCRGQLASFKIPREVRFVTEWPMSATKIQKFRLRQQLLAEGARSGGQA